MDKKCLLFGKKETYLVFVIAQMPGNKIRMEQYDRHNEYVTF